jgi:hypothetical protein
LNRFKGFREKAFFKNVFNEKEAQVQHSLENEEFDGFNEHVC